MERTKELKKYDVSPFIFEDILNKFQNRVKIVSNNELENYFKGYDNKKTIYYNGSDCLICQEYILRNYIDEKLSDWKQAIVRKSEGTKGIEDSLSGLRAYTMMMKLLKRFYTNDELEECFKTHEAEYDEEKAQVHYVIYQEKFKIEKYENCYQYDINSAHAFCLMEIFPKAAKEIERLYIERKEKPINKKILNYFVGFFCRRDHRKTYNWIVQKTTSKLLKAITYCGGSILYANTDGFIVTNPKNKLETSKKIGDFKLEYQGDVAIYYDKNYIAVQTDKIRGNLPLNIRDKIDLFENRVVRYDRIKTELQTYIAINVEEVKL